MTIDEFLLARFAEDAKRRDYLKPHTERCNYPGDMPGYCDCGLNEREIASKRWIVDHWLHGRWPHATEEQILGAYSVMRELMHSLASVYSTHPDFNPHWQISA